MKLVHRLLSYLETPYHETTYHWRGRLRRFQSGLGLQAHDSSADVVVLDNLRRRGSELNLNSFKYQGISLFMAIYDSSKILKI